VGGLQALFRDSGRHILGVLGETNAVQLFHDRVVDHVVALDGILLELALFPGQAIAANLLLSINAL
jgi:hypothetical protein